MSTRPHILLVDDRPDNLLALQAQLRTQDAEFLLAGSGTEALDLLLKREVALALIDVQMPGMDGFELAELMRGAERTREIPIIFVTAGLHDRSRVFKGYEAGAVDFLIKPVDPRVLCSKVSVFLTLERQKRQLAERVAELEAAREALRASAEESRGQLAELQSIYDSAHIGLCVFDREMRYLRVNQRLAELNGIPPEQHLGRTIEEVVPALAAAGREIAERVFRTGRGETDIEFTGETRSQPGVQRTWVEQWLPLRNAEGAVTAINVVAEEVTEQRRGSEALRASEARFRLLARTAGQLLRSEEPQRVIDALCGEVMSHLDCQAYFNFLVDPSEGRLRLNACAGISPEDAGRVQWLDYGVALGGCAAGNGVPLVAEDILGGADAGAGLARSFGLQACCCHPLMGQGGRVLGTLSFGTKTRTRFREDEVELMRVVADQVATALQRVQDRAALSLSNAQLVEADRRKNDFLATLSHELRNPLAPIKNSLYILEHAAPGGEQARRAQATLDRQVNQLARLVDDLLDVTRVSRNKIHLQCQRLQLDELVRKVLDDHRPEFEKAGVLLEHGASAPVWVNADASRLAQAVGNLLQNAVKFTSRGGRVRAAVSADEARKQAVIRVVDDGVGMDAKTLAELFEPFMQADRTIERSKGGLGLGLALVKGLVELHGGKVEARSEGLGRGTEFVLRLPLEPAAPAGAPETAERGAVRRRRVLIVEDNVDAAESLREVLELEGHQVAVAFDGPSGVRKAAENSPDLILCDIGLPGMDGYEVARSIRAAPRSAPVHLVALSGYALPEDVQRARDAGFDRHLAKPLSPELIRRLLEELSARGEKCR